MAVKSFDSFEKFFSRFLELDGEATAIAERILCQGVLVWAELI